jgi:hypothetical protein
MDRIRIIIFSISHQDVYNDDVQYVISVEDPLNQGRN